MTEQVSLQHVRAGVNRFKRFGIQVLAGGAFLLLAGSMLPAQVRVRTGAPARINRPLNIPPSVTSIENHMAPFLPNAPASVTSISPFNFNTRPFVNGPVSPFPRGGRHFNHCRGRGCGFGAFGGGYSYALPYYVYPYDSGYDSGDGSSGPYLYSGPPQGQTPPNEQTLHVIVDTAPAKTAPRDEVADMPSQPQGSVATLPEAKPGVPTTLIFRDGHKQQVTNYAIMDQTVYVFDDRTKKIALADLDIPATIKANDDEGVEFQVPKAKAKRGKPARSGMPLESTPDESQKPSTSTAATP